MKNRLGRCLRGALYLLAIAVPASNRAQEYVFSAYQQADGLANLSVQSLAFDRHGFLWIATENGLMRFLGSRFERYGPGQGIHERDIENVYVDPAGNVLAGTYKDVYRWDGSRFNPVAATPVPSDGGSSLLALAPGRLLVLSFGKIIEVSLDKTGGKRTPVPYFPSAERSQLAALDQVTTMASGRDGTLWLGCGSKLCSFRQGLLKTWGTGEGVPSSTWKTLHEDRRGSLWALSQQRLVELPYGALRFVDRTPPALPKGVFNWSPLAEDQQGRVLVNAERGLSRWDGLRWQQIGAENGLAAKRVTAIVFDPRGDAWVGSLSGLSHWTGYEHWEGWTEEQGLPSSTIWSIAASNPDHVLFGTVLGPARLDLTSRKVDSLVTGGTWPYGQVGGILEDKKGRVWITTFTGFVLVIEPATLRVREVAKLPVFIHRLLATADGRMWVLSGQGIDVIDRPEDDPPAIRHLAEVDRVLRESSSNTAAMAAIPLAGTGNFSASSTHKAADREELWFLTEWGPVRLRAGQWTQPRIDGMPVGNMVRDEIACAPDGSLWLTGSDDAERAGVWRLEPQGERYRASRLPLPDELDDSIIFAFLVDRRGWLWLGTDVGVFGWNGSVWRQFNHESGLIWNDTDRGVLREASDGSIWIGTMQGAARLLHPESAFEPVRLSVDILAMHRAETSIALRDDRDLAWENRLIRFDFASPSALNRGNLTFFYRLAGLDSSWVQTRDTQAEFAALPSGRYRFEVYASNSATASISAVATKEFCILPPWWRTRTFILLYYVAAILLFWLSLRLWTHRLRTNQQKLERLVSERTHALEQSREEMRLLATRDSLTGLLNRAAILAALDQELERARRSDTPLAVMIADIDHFKHVNDTYGHPAGDQVLRGFASGLSRNLRAYDHVGRYGGEEFLVVLGSAPQENLANFANRLARFHSEVSNRIVQVESHHLTVNCSIGVSILSAAGREMDATESLSSADKALYRAKRAGRNCLVVDESGLTSVKRQLQELN